MKPIIALLLGMSSVIGVFAQSKHTCIDLSANLSRGAESQNVLTFQTFLYAKGMLKATPNGYFGPATLAAAKAYQKSVGLPNTGAVLTLTRAAIKKETCTPATLSGGTSVQPTIVVASTTQASTTLFVRTGMPNIASVDKGTFFVGGTASWSAVIHGTGFSASSNTVYMRNIMTNKLYTIGVFPSTGTTTIVLPSTVMKDAYVCGNGCKEALPSGNYHLSVASDGGESNSFYVLVHGFTISSTTGSLYAPLKQDAANVLLGTISFSSPSPYYVSDIATTLTLDGLVGGTGVSVGYLKDQVTGQTITDYGHSFTVSENQSKIIGVYGSINSQTSGTVKGSVTITIMDYIGGKPVSYVAPAFMTTISGY